MGAFFSLVKTDSETRHAVTPLNKESNGLMTTPDGEVSFTKQQKHRQEISSQIGYDRNKITNKILFGAQKLFKRNVRTHASNDKIIYAF